ncbi:MAG TPA: FdtA/QdtA family cupin domain-containing protein [Cyclobacteriaceae bacterium]|nr:FdtA/QdtA family cupin domain-containing protein [Cyclobacteriaceae bacterium]
MIIPDRPVLINLPKIEDARGNLSFIEEYAHVPFKIERTFWIYDVPGGESRGGHAYRSTHEFIVALSGSFDVVVSDSTSTQKFLLNRSYYGLFVPKLFWRHMENFSTNSFALVLTDQPYRESDYIRDWQMYSKIKSGDD